MLQDGIKSNTRVKGNTFSSDTLFPDTLLWYDLSDYIVCRKNTILQTRADCKCFNLQYIFGSEQTDVFWFNFC